MVLICIFLMIRHVEHYGFILFDSVINRYYDVALDFLHSDLKLY